MIFSFSAKAKKKRPPWKSTRTPHRLDALSARLQRSISADLVHGLERFKLRVNKEEIYRAWLRGDYADLMRIIPWEELPGDLEPVTHAMRTQMPRVSAIALESLPPPTRPHLRFDMQNPRIRRYAERRVGTLVVGIQEDTRKFIANATARKFDTAMTPRRVADIIKPQIGLDPRRATALQNYRRGLEESGMGDARVERLTDAYEGRLLDSRAMTIARTESRQLENRGQHAVWTEALHQGLISADSRKSWITDGNPCEVCEPMDGVEVGLNETWTIEYPDGSTEEVDVPTDSHPNCECQMELVAESLGD